MTMFITMILMMKMMIVGGIDKDDDYNEDEGSYDNAHGYDDHCISNSSISS